MSASRAAEAVAVKSHERAPIGDVETTGYDQRMPAARRRKRRMTTEERHDAAAPSTPTGPTALIQAGRVEDVQFVDSTIPRPRGYGIVHAAERAARISSVRSEFPIHDPPPESIGDDSVVVGNSAPRRVGNRSVYVGATDAQGNTRIDGGTAIGAGARADSASVAIGAGALAGDDAIPTKLEQLRGLLLADGHAGAAAAAGEIATELEANVPDRARIKTLWTLVKTAATANEAVLLVHEIAHLLST